MVYPENIFNIAVTDIKTLKSFITSNYLNMIALQALLQLGIPLTISNYVRDLYAHATQTDPGSTGISVITPKVAVAIAKQNKMKYLAFFAAFIVVGYITGKLFNLKK